MIMEFFDSNTGKIIGFLGLGTFIALITFGLSLLKAPKIIRTLIKDNRVHPRNGYGKHYADRYISIWYKYSIVTNDSNIWQKELYKNKYS